LLHVGCRIEAARPVGAIDLRGGVVRAPSFAALSVVRTPIGRSLSVEVLMAFSRPAQSNSRKEPAPSVNDVPAEEAPETPEDAFGASPHAPSAPARAERQDDDAEADEARARRDAAAADPA
jgi:hypothetical protein